MGMAIFDAYISFRLVALEQYYKAEQSQTQQFDVIILDLDMPIMNGYEACKRIREKSKEGLQDLVRIGSRNNIYNNQYDQDCQDNDEEDQKILIVALSGLITESIIEKGKACGFDHCSKFEFLMIK